MATAQLPDRRPLSTGQRRRPWTKPIKGPLPRRGTTLVQGLTVGSLRRTDKTPNTPERGKDTATQPHPAASVKQLRA